MSQWLVVSKCWNVCGGQIHKVRLRAVSCFEKKVQKFEFFSSLIKNSNNWFLFLNGM